MLTICWLDTSNTASSFIVVQVDLCHVALDLEGGFLQGTGKAASKAATQQAGI
jgi:hypothetical protein